MPTLLAIQFNKLSPKLYGRIRPELMADLLRKYAHYALFPFFLSAGNMIRGTRRFLSLFGMRSGRRAIAKPQPTRYSNAEPRCHFRPSEKSINIPISHTYDRNHFREKSNSTMTFKLEVIPKLRPTPHNANPEIILAGVAKTIFCAASAPIISDAHFTPSASSGLRYKEECASDAITSTIPERSR